MELGYEKSSPEAGHGFEGEYLLWFVPFLSIESLKFELTRLMTVSATFREMYGAKKWALLPERSVVRQYMDEDRKPLERENFPNIEVSDIWPSCKL